VSLKDSPQVTDPVVSLYLGWHTKVELPLIAVEFKAVRTVLGTPLVLTLTRSLDG
jgi:hypothetical protein